jgi:hypothetical protein
LPAQGASSAVNERTHSFEFFEWRIDMSRQSILALIGAATIVFSTLALATGNEARAAEKKETVQAGKHRDARQSFGQVRAEGRVNEAQRPTLAQPDRLRPPAQPGQW